MLTETLVAIAGVPVNTLLPVLELSGPLTGITYLGGQAVSPP